MIFVIYCIATGCSYAYATRHVGMSLGKNTWTVYVKLLGIIAGEFLESIRRDPDFKWNKAQFDETAFGRR